MEKNTFTREEVKSLLVAACLFSGANNNQGLKPVKGANYGEQAETMIKAFESDKENSIVSIVGFF